MRNDLWKEHSLTWFCFNSLQQTFEQWESLSFLDTCMYKRLLFFWHKGCYNQLSWIIWTKHEICWCRCFFIRFLLPRCPSEYRWVPFRCFSALLLTQPGALGENSGATSTRYLRIKDGGQQKETEIVVFFYLFILLLSPPYRKQTALCHLHPPSTQKKTRWHFLLLLTENIIPEAMTVILSSSHSLIHTLSMTFGKDVNLQNFGMQLISPP